MLFSASAKDSNRPPNVHLMPSFSQSQLEADGVHLNPYSGLQYIMYLFDVSQDVFSQSNLDADARLALQRDYSRGLEDRVSALEQDHSRLNKSFEFQCAVSAEFADYQENVRNEDFIMVQGLSRLPKLDSKAWQLKAKESVDAVLSLMGFGYKTRYVQNSTGRGKDSRILYKARLESPIVSREVRDKFSSYFAGGKDSRPPALSNVSIPTASLLQPLPGWLSCSSSGTVTASPILGPDHRLLPMSRVLS